MPLPRKVREAGQKADDELNKLREKQGGDPGLPEPPANTNDPPPEPTPPEPAPKGTPEPGDKGGDPGKVDWKAEHGKLLQQHQVLQGKYNAEVPRLSQENRELNKQLDDLKGRIEALESNPPEPEIPDVDEENLQKLYGPDLLAYIKKQAQMVAGNVVENTVKPLSEKLETVERSDRERATDSFFGKIAEAHSDWQQINATDAFKTYLAEYIPHLGMERQMIVNNAMATGNPKPIIDILTEFKGLPNKAQERMAAHQVPSDDGRTPPPSESEEVRLKESEIQKFYVDVSRGKYNGRDKERNRLEAQIKRASETGNIIMDLSGDKRPIW